tara:strand:+ start:738 stop:968 length:231 start_codon:yes stop_codon:yes gene_type:complete
MVEVEPIDTNELCNTLMRQTNYDHDTAMKKLEEHEYDLMATIRDYLKPPKRELPKPKSKNQQIYTEIRTFMDNVGN